MTATWLKYGLHDIGGDSLILAAAFFYSVVLPFLPDVAVSERC